MREHFYEDIQGWFDFQKTYSKAVERCPYGGLMVEVGVWRGKSLCFLAVEALNSGKNLLICGVDHWQGGRGEEQHQQMLSQSDVRAECVANVQRVGNVLLLDGPSVKAARMMAPADFVFLDASHDYDSVCSDIQAWRQVVKPGGVLAGHDYHHDPVKEAVREALPDVRRTQHNVWWWHKP